MPFSWRIKDYLDELWVHALHREGNCMQLLYRTYIHQINRWLLGVSLLFE